MKEELIEILEELEHCTSREGKIKILINNKQNDQIKTLFYYVFNPEMKFDVDIKDFDYSKGTSKFKCIFDMLDNLLMNSRVNKKNIDDETEWLHKKAIEEMNTYIYQTDDKAKYWIIKVILKDLNIDVTIDMIKEVWKNFI